MAFEVNLYTVSDDANKVSKTLGTAKTYSSIIAKEPTDVTAPTVRIQTSDNLSGINYCYIAHYGRYYFVDKIITTPNGYWQLVCRCDVLMSYKNQIKALTGTVTRSESIYNGYLNDSEYKSYAYTETVTRKFPNDFEGTDSLVLITVG